MKGSTNNFFFAAKGTFLSSLGSAAKVLTTISLLLKNKKFKTLITFYL